MIRKYTGTLALLLSAATLVSQTTLAQNAKTSVRNIVLIHGAWADGSSWSKIIPLLAEQGFNVVAVQNPLTSLKDDVAATEEAISRVESSNPGPILLVAHSYGGTVMTEAGSDPNVVGLVYVAAFAPHEGESTLTVGADYPTAPALEQLVPDGMGSLTLNREGIFEDFAQDLSIPEKEVLFATQGPTALTALSDSVSSAAWRMKPCWFVVAADDRAISPALERAEAKWTNATTLVLSTSHVAMISQPKAVADFIAMAASKIRKK